MTTIVLLHVRCVGLKMRDNKIGQKIIITALAAVAVMAIPVNAQSVDIEYVSSILWSGVVDVELDSNYAYCAFVNGLVIIDAGLCKSAFYSGGDK
jgi:hypothetical protein